MGEKTEDPTPRKLEDAREKGQVPKSTDLAAAIDLLGGALLLAIFGAALARASLEVMRRGLDGFAGALSPDQVGAVVREITRSRITGGGMRPARPSRIMRRSRRVSARRSVRLRGNDRLTRSRSVAAGGSIDADHAARHAKCQVALNT